MNIVNRVSNLLFIPLSNLLNSGLPVKPLSNGLISLHKFIELFGQLFILDGNDSNVIVE